jgi:hypothetical protein
MVIQAADGDAATAGNGTDFVTHYLPCVPPVLVYFLRRTRSADDAEQAAEVIFRLAYQLTAAGETAGLSWLMYQAHRYWMDDLSTLGVRFGPDEVGGPLRGLPTEAAELLMLTEWDRVPDRELAGFLGVSTRKLHRRVGAARSDLAGISAIDPDTLSDLDPAAHHIVDAGRARKLLERIVQDGLLFSDSARRAAGPAVGRRSQSRRRTAVAAVTLVAAVVIATAVGVGSPHNEPAVGIPEASNEAVDAGGTIERQPANSTTYGPTPVWSRFEGLDGTLSFDVPPEWRVRYVATSRFSRSTLFAEVLSPRGTVMATISVGGQPSGTANCPAGKGETAPTVATVEQVPLPELGTGAGKANFAYQVITGSSVTAVLGISDGSFGDGTVGCARINAFLRDAPGDPVFVFVGGGSGADGTGPLSFPTPEDALEYVHTPAYQQTRRLMTSLRMIPPPTAERRIVRDPVTNGIACVVSNVRGPGNDTVYEDHPDYFVVLGCAGKYLAFRSSYQSDPTRPKTIWFATSDGTGYTFDPATSVRVLGWDELALQARTTGQDVGQMMDESFAADGLPVDLREALVGSGP